MFIKFENEKLYLIKVHTFISVLISWLDINLLLFIYILWPSICESKYLLYFHLQQPLNLVSKYNLSNNILCHHLSIELETKLMFSLADICHIGFNVLIWQRHLCTYNVIWFLHVLTKTWHLMHNNIKWGENQQANDSTAKLYWTLEFVVRHTFPVKIVTILGDQFKKNN